MDFIAVGRDGMDWIYLAQGETGDKLYYYGNTRPDYIRSRTFFDWLSVLTVFEEGFCSMDLLSYCLVLQYTN
jgi:hypothetical protein